MFKFHLRDVNFEEIATKPFTKSMKNNLINSKRRDYAIFGRINASSVHFSSRRGLHSYCSDASEKIM